MNISSDEKAVASAMAAMLGKRTHSEAVPQDTNASDGFSRSKIAKTGAEHITNTPFHAAPGGLTAPAMMNTGHAGTPGGIIPTPGMSAPLPMTGGAGNMNVNVNLLSHNMAMAEIQGPYPAFPAGPASHVRLEVEDENVPRELKPAPYFYYRDNSHCPDDDPLTPLTPLARVPNFPAKMQAILSRPDLRDVVTWMPHGRSWRVLKPREFEIRVIPTYFEHSKFSSFIRQANGWGFRRITRGQDRNSYYHELFLRGLPHLCKKMRRSTVSKKVEAEHEPDFYSISAEHPLPEKAETDYSILLPATLVGGPKARMPVGMMQSEIASAFDLGNYHQYGLHGHGHGAANAHAHNAVAAQAQQQAAPPRAPGAQDAKMPHDLYLNPSQQQLASQTFAAPSAPSGNGLPQVPVQGANAPSPALAQVSSLQQQQHPQQQIAQNVQQMQNKTQLQTHQHQHQQQIIAQQQQQARHAQAQQQQQQKQQQQAAQPPQPQQQQILTNQANAFQQAMMAAGFAAAIGNDPASQFAAGFAAATALNNPQFRMAFNQALTDGSSSTGAAAAVPQANGATAVPSNINATANYSEQNAEPKH